MVWGFLGVLLTSMSWLALVPWDLSEIDRQGHSTGRSVDKDWELIAAILGIIFIAGLLVVLLRPRGAAPFAIGASTAWAALFAWRAAASRVSGANMWILSFAYLVVPAAAGVGSVVASLAKTRLSKLPGDGR